MSKVIPCVMCTLYCNRYEIQSDVRQAIYGCVNVWMKGIGKKRKFLGGDKPNLADLVSVIDNWGSQTRIIQYNSTV